MGVTIASGILRIFLQDSLNTDFIFIRLLHVGKIQQALTHLIFPEFRINLSIGVFKVDNEILCFVCDTVCDIII